MVYLRKGSNRWWMTVPTRERGAYQHLTSGVTDKATAEAMERMMDTLGPSGTRQWDLYDAVLEGRLEIGRLFDAYVLYLAGDAAALDRLRKQMDDVDLAPGVA